MSETTESGFDVKENYTRLEDWFNRNSKLVYIVLGSLAGIVLLYVGYKKLYAEPRRNKAYAEMRFAENYFGKYISDASHRDSLNLALNGDRVHKGFLQIIDKYGGTDAGNLAQAYAGIIYLYQGKFKDAADHLEKFEGNDPFVAPEVIGDIGDAYAELNNFDKALEYYKKAAYQSDNDQTAPLYLKRAGMLCEKLKKYDEARKYYEEIKNKYPKTQDGSTIDKYLSRLDVLQHGS